MWRAINGEFFLSTDDRKRVFLDRFFKFSHVAGGAVLVYAFVAMSNHFHKAGELLGDSNPLSRWARSAHASFALWLNRKLGRRGPVAQDRPKTVVAEDQEHLKRLMFYIDWNPVRAGMCQHPSQYEFSSYRYYAYGEVNKWTQCLTPPLWYVELGSTPEERQERYRQECDRYFREGLVPDDASVDDPPAMGSPQFVKRRTVLMKAIGKLLVAHTMLREDIDYLVRLAFGPAAAVRSEDSMRPENRQCPGPLVAEAGPAVS
jgi:putative transposase